MILKLILLVWVSCIFESATPAPRPQPTIRAYFITASVAHIASISVTSENEVLVRMQSFAASQLCVTLGDQRFRLEHFRRARRSLALLLY
jgi:hypothetical protein